MGDRHDGQVDGTEGRDGEGGQVQRRRQSLFDCLRLGTRKWVLRFTWRGRAREMGLGSAATVSLADAREKAAHARRMVAHDIDPIHQRKRTGGVPPFGEMADQVRESLSAGFRNEKHKAQWTRATLDLDQGMCGRRASAPRSRAADKKDFRAIGRRDPRLSFFPGGKYQETAGRNSTTALAWVLSPAAHKSVQTGNSIQYPEPARRGLDLRPLHTNPSDRLTPDRQGGGALAVQTAFTEGVGTAFFKKQTALVGFFSGGFTNVQA
jgi:Arm DNA-binding domain